MKNLPFPDDSPQLQQLGVLVRAYAGATRRIRELEAERLRLLGSMAELADRETVRVSGRRLGGPVSGFSSAPASADGSAPASESYSAPVAEGAEPAGGPVVEVNSAVSGMAYRTVACEVGLAVEVSDREVMRDLELAMRLADDYPALHERMREGALSVRHARAVVDAGGIIPEARDRGSYGAEAVAAVSGETPNRAARLVRIIAAKYVPEPEERERAAVRARSRVDVLDLEDGLAELRAVLNAVQAHAIKDRLTRQARAVQRREVAARRDAEQRARVGGRDVAQGARISGRDVAPAIGNAIESAAGEADCSGDGPDGWGGGPVARHGDEAGCAAGCGLPAVRPLDQIRVGILADELLNASPTNETGDTDLSRIDARIQVTVPVLGLLPEEQRPDRRTGIAGLQGAAVLAGCGPIDADTARFLAALQPRWDVLACHPVTGELVSVDAYRPSERLRRRIFARDQHCRYPGCLTVPHRADIDHTRDHALGGPTASDNTEVLCRYHHTLKHHTGVCARLHANGDVEWTTPLGAVTVDRPASRVMFRPVPPDDDAPGSPEAGRRVAPGSKVRSRSRPRQEAHETPRAREPDTCPF